MPNMRRPLGSS